MSQEPEAGASGVRRSDPGDARRFLRGRRHGVLSTVSLRFSGYPYGSAVPFVLDHAARPVILISRLAEHTRNLGADPRASLLVQDAAPDVQAVARLTLIADASAGTDMSRTRYLNYLPDAAKWLALGDFSFWTLAPRAVRFIGGFGDIRWIDAAAFAPPSAPALAAAEADIVAHMTESHASALRDYCRFYHGRDADTAVMAGVDCEGFDIRADGELLRFEFGQPVPDAAAARAALVAMAQAARAE